MAARRPTAGLRPLPDFLILGVQKAGTTTLYSSLVAQPLVLGALHKEVHFFDRAPLPSLGWYRAHFPLAARRRAVQQRHPDAGRAMTGEASPYYLFHPAVPGRVRDVLPDVALIAVLRDPVARAISGYYHAVRFGFEDRPIELALDPDAQEELPDESDAAWFDRDDCPARRRGYLARGVYADQLARWLRVFPREQLLVLETSELVDLPPRRLREFLGLSEAATTPVASRNVGAYEPADDEVRRRLARYFGPHNARLFELLGERWDWERA